MNRRLAIRAIGWCLTATAVIYLAAATARSDAWGLLGHLRQENLAVATATALIYATALYALAAAWGVTLRTLCPADARLRTSLRIYALTTFAKYLPGNVFHFVGRQIAAADAGYDQKSVAQATAVEIVGHLCAAGLLLLALLPFALERLNWTGAPPGRLAELWPYVLIPALLLGGGLLHLERCGHRVVPRVPPRALALVVLLQLVFFLAATAMTAWLGLAMLGLSPAALPMVAFVCLAAWLIGFVTPGAPAGLGVREACLVAGLSAYGDPSAVLAFAALSRAALLLGEGLFALSGFLLVPSSPRPVGSRASRGLTMR